MVQKTISSVSRPLGWREVEEGKRGINSDRKRLDFGWVNTQYNIQTMYYRIVHLKPI